MKKSILRKDILSFLLSLSCFQSFAQGDRNAMETEVYPPYCFVNTETSIDSNATVNVIDVTKYPFFAIPDDGIDDTEAICEAINWAHLRHDEFGWRHPGLIRTGAAGRYIVYIPNGTYDISDKLTSTDELSYLFEGDTLQSVNRRIEHSDMDVWSNLCIIGQNKDSTIIRLADNAPGFGPGSKKPVIDCNPSDKFNNNIFGTVLRNFTIHTGSGNAGAVGIEYQNANTKSNSVRNIRIISDDGSGHAGIRTHIGSVHGYIHDIIIDGFDYGITTEQETDVVFCLEHISLRNQQIAGMRFDKGVVTLRKILSQNDVPAIIISDARVPLLDSRFESSGNAGTAIVNNHANGILFARNVVTTGYENAIQMSNGSIVPSGTIEEFVSTEPVTLWENQIKKSLNVPIKDAPVIPSVTDFTQWARPADYGVPESDGQYSVAAVQAALNSGKPVIVFPYAPVKEDIGTFTTKDYNDKDVTFFTRLRCDDQGYERAQYEVPASVKQIKGFYRRVKDFVITEASDEPLYIQDVMCAVTFKASRPVIIEGGEWLYIINKIESAEGKPAEVFVNCGGVFREENSNYPFHAYIRFLDVEGGTKTLIGENMRMVVLSFKTEFSYSNNFDVTNGGIFELFGAKHLVANNAGTYFINNDNSYVSMAASMPKENSRGSREFEIREVRNSEERLYSVPVGRSIGLYSGYKAFNQVSIIQPESNAEFNIGDSVTIKAEALDFFGTIDSVRFYANGTFIGSTASEPFELIWENPPENEYELHAEAYRDNASTVSSPLPITVYGYRNPDDPGEVLPGIIYEYYEGQWETLPDFSTLPVVKKDTVSNFHIDRRLREDEYGFRFFGYIKINQEGYFTFYSGSNDGSKLFIGDRLIVDNDGIHSYLEEKGGVFLKEGLHKIEVQMFDYMNTQHLNVKMEGPGSDLQLIPDSILFRPKGTPPAISVLNPLPGMIYNENETIRLKTSLIDAENDVYKIDFLIDDELAGSVADTLSTFDIDTLSAGNHTVKAIAYDLGGGQSTSAQVSFFINDIPSVIFLQPPHLAEYSILDTILFEVEVEDKNLKEVRFLVNETVSKILTQAPWEFRLSNLEKKSYFITAIAIDEYNTQSDVKIQVKVVNTSPEISIITPTDGSVFEKGERIEFKAEVYDPDNDIYKVAFYRGNNQIGDNANIFYVTTVSNLPDGVHTVTAKAFDKGGAIVESESIGITVGNPININETFFPAPEILIYRSEAHGPLQIRSPGLLNIPGNCEIFIYDISGRKIYQENIDLPANTIQIPFQVFPYKGIYVFGIQHSDQKIQYNRIVVL